VTKVAFVVNGGPESAMGVRAASFERHLRSEFSVRTAHRTAGKVASIARLFRFLIRERPAVVYVFDMAFSGVLGAATHKLIRRTPLVIDTGDVIYELARSSGMRGWLGLALTRALEEFSLRVADVIVVRGTFHEQYLTERGVQDVVVVQDGVDTDEFQSAGGDRLRRELGIDGVLTVGLVGTSVWSERLQMCYGWELVELMRLLKDEPVKGVVIGEGSGVGRLKEQARRYGVDGDILFLGYVPYTDLPRHLAIIDICLSTQTNDLVGRVRTTGKLPLYMAVGRYILASDVGEASLVLGPDMLVEYNGVRDGDYPERLAARVRALLKHPERLRKASSNQMVAREQFDYAVLSERVATLLRRLASAQRNAATELSHLREPNDRARKGL
jgi:glycosyltransferase involved in cell wall biosynthesis